MSRRTKEQILSERVAILKTTSIFSESDDLVLKEIALQLTEKKVEKGKVIFRKGSLGKAMYIVAEGMVRIHDGGHVYSKMKSGNVFGEYALIDEETRSASVTAEKDSLLYKLEQDDFYSLLSQKQEITKEILKALIKRIRTMNVLEEKLSKNFLKIQNQKKEIEYKHHGLSEKKELLEIQNFDLLSLNEEKNRQIGILVHGMKNPLTSSLCLSDLLLHDDSNLTEDQKKYIELVHTSSVRMNKLINEILNIDSLESKTLRLKMERINVRKIINDVIESLNFAAQKKKVEIITDLELVEAKLNPSYIFQIIENLIDNAIKFTPNNSKVRIKSFRKNNKIYVQIEDEGPGIPEDDIPLIFELYERQTEVNNQTPLNGLGLAIVDKYAKAMNGEVKCESTLNEGTKFTIIFDEFLD